MTEYNEASRASMAKIYGVEKTRDAKREGGLIENWSVVSYLGQDEKKVVVGTLNGDERWVTGGPIRTSLIVRINEDESEVETLNTVYKLGTKAPA